MSGLVTLGRALFAPDEHPHRVEVQVALDRQSFRAAWGSAPGWEDDCHAFCLYDYDSKGPVMGALVFDASYCTRAVLAHECTHAALSFVGSLVMSSAAVQAMSDHEQHVYFDEAVPTVVEKLFAQAETFIFGPGGPLAP